MQTFCNLSKDIGNLTFWQFSKGVSLIIDPSNLIKKPPSAEDSPPKQFKQTLQIKPGDSCPKSTKLSGTFCHVLLFRNKSKLLLSVCHPVVNTGSRHPVALPLQFIALLFVLSTKQKLYNSNNHLPNDAKPIDPTCVSGKNLRMARTSSILPPPRNSMTKCKSFTRIMAGGGVTTYSKKYGQVYSSTKKRKNGVCFDGKTVKPHKTIGHIQ